MDADLRLPDQQQSAAVIVGVTAYSPQWSPAALPQLGRGAARLRDALVAGGGFAADRVTTLLDGEATHGKVVDAVRTACQTSSDTVLLYFGGHAVVSGQRLLLALTGADPHDTHLRMIPMTTICKVIGDRMPARFVVLLDCCHAGLASTDVSDLAARMPPSVGVALLSAVPATGRAIATGDRAGHTLFTGAVIDALRTGTSARSDLLTLQWLADEVRDRCERATPSSKTRPDLPGGAFYGHGRTSLLALAVNPASRPAHVVVDLRDHDEARGVAAVLPVGGRVVRLPDAPGPVGELVARHAADGVARFTVVHPSDWGETVAASVETQLRAASGVGAVEVRLVPRAVALVVEARSRGDLVVRDGERLLVVEESSGEASATLVEVGRGWKVRSAPATALAGLPAEIAADRRAGVLTQARAAAGRPVRVVLVTEDAAVSWPVGPKALVARVLLDDGLVFDGAQRRVAADVPVRPVAGAVAAAPAQEWWRAVPWPVAALGAGLGAVGFFGLYEMLGAAPGVAAAVAVAAALATVVVGARDGVRGGTSDGRGRRPDRVSRTGS